MNRVILQLWEESNRESGVFTDGCSIHIDESERNSFISRVYIDRNDKKVPEQYDRVVGGEIEVFVSDSVYQLVLDKKSIKLSEVEFNNLIRFEEIIYNFANI